MIGGYIFHFKIRFFEKGIRMLKFEKDMFHKHNGIKSLTDNEVHAIQYVYWEAEQKIICPFCYMTRKRLVEKSTYLDLPNEENGKAILHGYPFIKCISGYDWVFSNEFSHEITLLIDDKDYGFVLYRELIRNNFLVENLSLEKIHRCPKCNRRLD